MRLEEMSTDKPDTTPQILAALKRQGREILCPMGLRGMEVVERELDLGKPHDGEDRTMQK